MKLNKIFGLTKMRELSSNSGTYVPPLIREFADDTPAGPVEEGQPNEWTLLGDPARLVCTFQFDDPSIMRRFVSEVMDFQEDAQHHGKILIESQAVNVEVWTHDINDVTELDREYASELTDIYDDVMGIYGNV
jgi:pterin-4a-carbinolamine dehydratase